MGIYLYNFISLPIFRVLSQKKWQFCFIVSVQLFLILALRDELLGVDLPNYIGGYQYISTLSFSDMLSRLNLLQAADLVYPYSYESGYVVLNWLVSHLGFTFHDFLVLCAFVNIVSFSTFIYRYSKEPLVSYEIFIALNMFAYCFGIIRQSLAVSIVLWAVPYVLKQNRIKVALIILLAMTFHRTALLIVPVFVLKDIVISKKIFFRALIIFAGSTALAPLLYQFVIVPVLAFLGKGYNSIQFKLNNLYLLLIVIVLVIILFIDIRQFSNSKILNMSCWALLEGIGIEILGLCNDVFARSVEYPLAFLLILIPNLIHNYKVTTVKRCALICISIMLFVFLFLSLDDNSIVPYMTIYN